MDQAISKLLFIGAAIAIAATVVAVAWGALGSNTPSTGNGPDYASIRHEQLCKAAGGVWTATSDPPCAA